MANRDPSSQGQETPEEGTPAPQPGPVPSPAPDDTDQPAPEGEGGGDEGSPGGGTT